MPFFIMGDHSSSIIGELPLPSSMCGGRSAPLQCGIDMHMRKKGNCSISISAGFAALCRKSSAAHANKPKSKSSKSKVRPATNAGRMETTVKPTVFGPAGPYHDATVSSVTLWTRKEAIHEIIVLAKINLVLASDSCLPATGVTFTGINITK